MNDNEYNKEKLHEKELYNKIISSDKISDEVDSANNVTEQNDALESTDESRQTNEANLIEIRKSFINRKNNFVFFIN